MIKLRNVAKCYKTNAGFTYVLQQINVDVQEGEFITIMGPSGAGKSTLLGILGMLDGEWDGRTISWSTRSTDSSRGRALS